MVRGHDGDQVRFGLAALLLAIAASGFGQDISGLFDKTDRDREIALGRATYDALVQKGLISRNEAYTNRVDRVFGTLLNVLPNRLMPFQVVLVGTSEVNAFCTPGGFVCIYEGLVSQIKDDDALAMVLAHEIGHGYLHHTMRGLRNAQQNVILDLLVGTLTGVFTNSTGLNRIAFTREMEREADAFGAELYLKAGYEPTRITHLLEVLQHLSPDDKNYPYYLRTHPLHKERIEAVRNKRDQLLAGGLKPVDSGKPNELDTAKVFGVLPGEPWAENKYFPLEPGTQWEYQIKGGASYRVNVVGVAQVDGAKVARMRVRLGQADVEYQCLTSAATIWRRDKPDLQASQWKAEYCIPPGVEPVIQGPWTFRRLGAEPVEIPLGKYENAVKVEAIQGERVQHLWFAEGVGLIKRLNLGSQVEEVLVRIRRSG